MKNSEIYHETLSSALDHAAIETASRGFAIVPEQANFPHVNYGTTERRQFDLVDGITGEQAKKKLHIQIYRMDSGSYELNFYIQ